MAFDKRRDGLLTMMRSIYRHSTDFIGKRIEASASETK